MIGNCFEWGFAVDFKKPKFFMKTEILNRIKQEEIHRMALIYKEMLRRLDEGMRFELNVSR